MVNIDETKLRTLIARDIAELDPQPRLMAVDITNEEIDILADIAVKAVQCLLEEAAVRSEAISEGRLARDYYAKTMEADPDYKGPPFMNGVPEVTGL